MQLLPIIRQIRDKNPRLSCREIYYMLLPKYTGRDRFEAFCFDHGLKLEVTRNWHRTTDSLGVIRFPNLLLDLDELTGVNQVWVSDITYYQINKEVFYLTFITDLYSRAIVGYCSSESLLTEETTLVALKMALKARNIGKNSGLIIHSDGGGQYYCKEFISITNQYGMRNSMGKNVFENPHAERVNGTIKNDYLIPYLPKNFEELGKMLTKVVNLYNTFRPHKSLKKLAPYVFENMINRGLLTKTWIINKKKKVVKKEKVNINII